MKIEYIIVLVVGSLSIEKKLIEIYYCEMFGQHQLIHEGEPRKNSFHLLLVKAC